MTTPIISGPYRTFRALNANESYIEFEGSTITIPMRGRRSPSEAWLEERIKLQAFMRLEIYPPYYNNLGTREFQFTIRDWDLFGKSPMLNELFFGDPRGQLIVDERSGYSDYVPASLTFSIAHHYRLGFEPETPPSIRELFGEESKIEIRNLTSHDFRVWSPFEELDESQFFYSNQNNRIYWEILSVKSSGDASLNYLISNNNDGKTNESELLTELMIFHKKSPEIPGDTAPFDIANAQDRARYLLAATPLQPSKHISHDGAETLLLHATVPRRGYEVALVRSLGNTVISSLHRPSRALEIKLPIRSTFTSNEQISEHVSRVFDESKSAAVKGWIQVLSPAKCLCTADQAPALGSPADSADFPARITYAANYDVYINGERFVEDQAGIAIAVGALEIPPRDVKVAFEKPQAGLVTNRFLNFSSGDCTGMQTINLSEYEQGVNYCRYWRALPLAPEQLTQNDGFHDYDPGKTY